MTKLNRNILSGMEKEDQIKAILKEVKEQKCEIIWLWFVDILGLLKGVGITPRELEGALYEGVGFDGSSVEGFARIHESDLMAVADPSTFTWLPEGLSPQFSKIAIMFCDLYTPQMEPFPGDSRLVLKKQVEKLRKKGYTFYIGPEIEYFYFKDMEGMELFDSTGYFDASLMNIATLLRRKSILALEQMGIECEFEHHEVSPSQHELDLKYKDALTMAEEVLIARFIIKEIARSEGAYATFMPKPIFGINGSGMHCHQSIFEGEKNLFFEANDEYNLSQFARWYIAGILTHIREITIVLNQWINSYKRLVPGYEAPVYISWGQKNRSALVRVPRVKVGKETSSRIELRSPDPVCNPYLAFACMIASGMDGVEKKFPLPPPIEENIYEMSPKEREERGIATLPDNLFEAIQVAKESEFLKEILGEHIYYKLIDNKLIEWDQYRIQVSDWELKKYLPIL